MLSPVSLSVKCESALSGCVLAGSRMTGIASLCTMFFSLCRCCEAQSVVGDAEHHTPIQQKGGVVQNPLQP